MSEGIDQIVFLTETPFRERDYHRFGIAILSRHFKVLVFDCTPLLRPAMWKKLGHLRFEWAGYSPVYQPSDIEKNVSGWRNRAIAIDYLFSGKSQQYFRNLLRKNGVLRSIFLGPTIPNPKKYGVPRLRQIARSTRDLSLCIFYSFRCGMNPAIPIPWNIADIAVLSGQQSMCNPKSRSPHRIWAHHFDYDTYLALRDQPTEPISPYALFLDQDFLNNSDRMITGTPAYVTAEKYYLSLNRFFSEFENLTGLPVVIAAHPKSDLSLTQSSFMGRTTIHNDSANLTRNASLVFGHYSFALSFAILWEKPIVLLSTDELLKYYLYPCIEAYRDSLRVPLLNVDSYKLSDIISACRNNVALDAYKRFKEQHIKTAGTPELPLWEIFSFVVKKRFY